MDSGFTVPKGLRQIVWGTVDASSAFEIAQLLQPIPRCHALCGRGIASSHSLHQRSLRLTRKLRVSARAKRKLVRPGPFVLT